MKSRTDWTLIVMTVLAWIVAVGLAIKAGAILVSYIVSIGNPIAAKDLYKGTDLYNLRQYDFGHYTGSVMLMIILEMIKCYIAFMVIRVVSKIRLANPFKPEVARDLEKISYYIIGVWVLAALYNAHLLWLSKRIQIAPTHFVSMEFILLACVVFVFSQIFKRGVELQTENELTV
ncbi:MAG TPA: DUF2975 domain-containing protein [Puia sp.]|nr:DUF2975 domain-containing protein [Puia sp.]